MVVPCRIRYKVFVLFVLRRDDIFVEGIWGYYARDIISLYGDTLLSVTQVKLNGIGRGIDDFEI